MSASFFCTSCVAAQRPAELLAVERVLPRAVHAVLGGAHRAPGDAVAGAVEAAERPLEAGHVGQQRALRHHHAVHHDLAGDGGAQAKACRRSSAPTGPSCAFLEDEAADLVVVRGRLRPDHEHVGDRRVGDPHLAAGQPVAVRTPSRRGSSCRRDRSRHRAPVRPKQPTHSPVASLGRYFLRWFSSP